MPHLSALQQAAAYTVRWRTFTAWLGRRVRRVEVRRRLQRYLCSVLVGVERRNGWQLGEAAPDGVQRLLTTACWGTNGMRDDLRSYAVEHLGHADGVSQINFVRRVCASLCEQLCALFVVGMCCLVQTEEDGTPTPVPSNYSAARRTPMLASTRKHPLLALAAIALLIVVVHATTSHSGGQQPYLNHTPSYPSSSWSDQPQAPASQDNSWVYHGLGGNAGGNGNGCSYYNDPETGSSVMTGNC